MEPTEYENADWIDRVPDELFESDGALLDRWVDEFELVFGADEVELLDSGDFH